MHAMIYFINYDFAIAGGVGVITTIISGIFGALLAVLTARRCAKIGEKPLCGHCRLMPNLNFHYDHHPVAQYHLLDEFKLRTYNFRYSTTLAYIQLSVVNTHTHTHT